MNPSTTHTAAGMALSGHPTRVRFGKEHHPADEARIRAWYLASRKRFFLHRCRATCECLEGDGGASFVAGEHVNYTRCAKDAEQLFQDVREVWSTKNLIGQLLYAYAESTARKMGWELNFDPPGHWVSNFPHATIYTGSLANFEITPLTMRWILEIHLRDPQ